MSTFLGYDWPRFHAAVNDFPAALLVVSVLFDGLGAALRREQLRIVGFWTLMVGVLGTAVAVIAGLQAEDVIDHSDEAHAIMEQHQTLGLIVLSIFAVLAVWRLVRRAPSRREQGVALLVGLIGLLFLVRTAQLGGSLTFDHALGVSNARLHVIEEQRLGEQHEHHEAGAAMPRADTTSHTHPE